MLRKTFALFSLVLFTSFVIVASSDNLPAKKEKWSFDGMFGTFDRGAIQRGFQVYKEVCAACHSVNLLSFRNLKEIGFSEAEAKEIAKSYNVSDGPNDEGEMFERQARLSDRIPGPYSNEKAARASNNGAFPPDLSLIIRARENGANYVYSILTGYDQVAPKDMQIPENMHYNPYFPGMKIAMTKPLSENIIQYSDGTLATVDNMAHDVVNFLQWASDTKMEKRKKLGIKVLIYLSIFTGLFYIAYKRVWQKI